MSRPGRIARLPQAVREKLNRRLREAEPGGPLLEWLYVLPEAKAVLQTQSTGQPISKQNFSEWRLGEKIRTRSGRVKPSQTQSNHFSGEPARGR